MAVHRTIIRTLFYQYFILFVGIAAGFIANAEYVGWKSVIAVRSFNNIFYPIKYDENVEKFVIGLGRARLATTLFGHPYVDLTDIITEERVWGEEYYDALYRVPDAEEETIELYQTRVRWKPWEYYYEFHEGTNGEDILNEAPPPPKAVDTVE